MRSGPLILGSVAMPSIWELHETSTHQDHVIAHVMGATVLGYFEFDQSAHLVLDIGFIWIIFVDGEMGLVPQTMAISELEIDAAAKAELRADVQSLHDDSCDNQGLARIALAPAGCLITDVSFYAHESNRRLLVTGEEASLEIKTSLLTGEIHVSPV